MRAYIGKATFSVLTTSALVATLVANLATTTVAEASCVPGFDFAAFGRDEINMSGGAVTSSFDSSLGTYATQCTPVSLCATGGNVCTNGTTAGAVDLSGSTTDVNGTVCIGAGGSTGTAITTSGGASYDSGYAQTTNTNLPSVVYPDTTYTDAVPFNVSITSPTTLAPGLEYGDISVSGGPSTTLTLNAGVYLFKTLSMSGNSSLIVGSGPIIVYIYSDLDLSGGTVTNASNKSTDLIFMVSPAASTVKFSGGTNSSFACYAPDSNVDVSGGSAVFGAIVGKKVTLTGGTDIIYDKALAGFAAGPFACAAGEVSRASPVIATILGDQAIVQGTYEYPFPTLTQATTPASLAAFRFPQIQGHLRASKIAQFGTTALDFTGRTGVNEIFDSMTLIPNASYAPCAMFDGTCRTVFTTIVGGDNPARVHLSSANVSTIGPLMAAGSTLATTDYPTLMTRILMGDDSSGSFKPKLGGIDRSTVAVIPFSLVAGTARPTMIYVGGTDGMLHAFCGDNTAPCTIGKELWAYIPRVFLSRLRLNNQAIIDGSARVVDMFGDFDGDGTKSFSTILLFQTGTGVRATDQTPAVYALDITDPRAPKVLWERTMTSVAGTAGTYELGQGQMIAAGQVVIAGSRKNAAFVQTNNGAAIQDAGGSPGAGASGSVITAINIENGDDLWPPHTYAYPNPHVAPRVVGDAPVPKQAVPGGVVGYDSTNTGTITDLVFGTIYGDLWVLDPATGVSRFGSGPLFQLSRNYEPIGAPPAIFATSGSAYAVAATGAYWDRTGSTWNSAVNQHLFAVNIKTTTPGFPFSELTTPSASAMKFATSFSSGQKASSQVLIVGAEIFYTTDTNDINSASYGTGTSGGAAYKTDLGGVQTGSDTVVVTGVGSLASAGGEVFASGGKGSEQVSFNTNGSTGDAVNGSTAPQVNRRLWLRTL